MDKLLRFELLNCVNCLRIDDIDIISCYNNSINLIITTSDTDATPKRLDYLLQKNCPELHSRYLFTYRIVRPT